MEPHSASLGALYATHAPGRSGWHRITGDGMLAEDLVQEAFVRLANRFPDLRDPSAFGAYLQTTVTNLARSHFRRLSVERTYLEREAGTQVMTPDPDSQREVQDTVLRLPPRQRVAIALRYYEDLSVGQVADVLGCPAGTVKSLAARGIAQLRRDLLPGWPRKWWRNREPFKWPAPLRTCRVQRARGRSGRALSGQSCSLNLLRRHSAPLGLALATYLAPKSPSFASAHPDPLPAGSAVAVP